MVEQSADRERVALIEALNVLDPHVGTALDPITQLAAFSFDVPIALVSVVDDHSQRLISRVGLDVEQTPLDVSVCAHALHGTDVFEIEDLGADPRFAHFPVVIEAKLRFYAGAPLRTKSGVAIGTLCIMGPEARRLSDEERRQLQTLAAIVMAQLELMLSLGRRDAVTGLPNRQQFQADLTALQRTSPGATLTAVLVDVLDINAANDAGEVLGMRPVESLLRQAALRVQQELRGLATVCHVGVTRFAFVLEHSSHAETEALMHRLQQRLRRPLLAGSIPMSPQFHAGLVDFQADDDDIALEDVLRRCLIAMHSSIHGDHCYCWYSAETDAALKRRYRLAADVQRGLAQGQFSLVFQPRHRVGTLQPVAAEALLRWTHPLLGPISPAEFIPVLERTALIRPLGRWVAEHAFAQAREFAASVPGFAISINLSPREFDDPELASELLDAVARHGLSPSQVEIEITEGQWLSSHPNAQPQLARIADAGVGIAIDDFGSGYSNFAYLSEVPIETIKIDKSLVTGMERSRTARLKVEAIIALARNLGYRTVAEGVENAEELALLGNWNCDEAQGYHLARPMAADQLMAYLRDTPRQAAAH